MRNSLPDFFRCLRFPVVFCLCAGALADAFAAGRTPEAAVRAYGDLIAPQIVKVHELAGRGNVPKEFFLKLWIDPKGVVRKLEILDAARKPLDLPKFSAAMLAWRFSKVPADVPMPYEVYWKDGSRADDPYAVSLGPSLTKAGLSVDPTILPPEFIIRLWIDPKGVLKKVEVRDTANQHLGIPELSKALLAARFPVPSANIDMPVRIEWKTMTFSQVVVRGIQEKLNALPAESVPSTFVVKIWIDPQGVPTRVETLDVFKNPFSNPQITAELMKARFQMPIDGVPMPVVMRISADKDKAGRLKDQKKAAN